MGRRRLIAIVGTFGLLAALSFSGVVAQAEIEPPTLANLVLQWQASTQDVCLSNGTSVALTGGVCVINQGVSSEDNVAICIQNSTDLERCQITQANENEDNRALVLQVRKQSHGPSQDARQDVTITQTTTSGRNDTWGLQVVKQVTGDTSLILQQDQTSSQTDTIQQTSSLGGGQQVGLGQVSIQQENSNTALRQNQSTDQDVSDRGHHINQTSTGISKVLVGQLQLLQTHSPAAIQDQQVDPRCCSDQQSNPGDTFDIAERVSILNDGRAGSTQHGISVAQCHTSGKCKTVQSTAEDGSVHTNNCSSNNCTAVVDCTNGTCAITTDTTCPAACPTPPHLCFFSCLGLRTTTGLGNVALRLAPRGRTLGTQVARTAPNVSLAT
jgi:hypothetical protein